MFACADTDRIFDMVYLSYCVDVLSDRSIFEADFTIYNFANPLCHTQTKTKFLSFFTI